MEDIWTYHPDALGELILNALERRDFGLLRGLQCFSEATRWTVTEGMESIINTLFEKSIEMKREAEDLRSRLTADEAHYMYIGTYEKMKRRLERLEKMQIPFIEVKSVCRGLSPRQFLEHIEMLEESGFIETNRSGGWERSLVWLPRRYWDGIIDDAISRGSEDSIYGSALGTMIAHASRGKTVRTLKPIVNVLNKSKDGETTENEATEEYIKQQLGVRKWYNFKKRDSMKNEQIKAIVYADGRKIIFSREMVLANRQWLTMTHELLRRRGRGE